MSFRFTQNDCQLSSVLIKAKHKKIDDPSRFEDIRVDTRHRLLCTTIKVILSKDLNIMIRWYFWRSLKESKLFKMSTVIHLRGLTPELSTMGVRSTINSHDSHWYTVLRMWTFFGANTVSTMLSYITTFIYWYTKEEGI